MLRTERLAATVFLLPLLAPSPALARQDESPASTLPSWESVLTDTEEMARPLVEDGLTVGMVIGIRRGDETRVLAFGETELGSGKAPDANSVYEIGSVSKVFTGVLLADAVTRGHVKLDDTVESIYEGVFEMPRFEQQPIEVWHLSTHTSGLPRMPSNFTPADPLDPYADYTLEQMYAALERYKLRRAPGERYAYSNLGVGLLGNLVAFVQPEEASYAQLLAQRITGPLQLEHTAIALTPWMQEHLVPGYDVDQNPQHVWNLPTLAGAGGIRSNVNDMLQFAEVAMHPEGTPLEEAMKLSQEVRYEEPGGVMIGLGWHAGSAGATRWHNGQTGGYHTFFALWPEGDAAVVLLANTTSGWVDMCGNNALAMMMGGKPRPYGYQQALTLEEVDYAAVLGEYKMGMMAKLTVVERGGQLFAQMSFQPELRIYPAGDDRYFYRAVEAELIFQRDGAGAVTGIEIEQNGRTTKGRRK